MEEIVAESENHGKQFLVWNYRRFIVADSYLDLRFDILKKRINKLPRMSKHGLYETVVNE